MNKAIFFTLVIVSLACNASCLYLEGRLKTSKVTQKLLPMYSIMDLL